MEKSLRDYIAGAWHIVEPTVAYQPNWHIDCICDHLEAVTKQDIRDLVINIPPGCAKSLTVSVFWMTWTWTTIPALRWLYMSYEADLSLRDSVKCRRIIQDDWYQKRWGGRFSLTSDQNVKSRFENDQTGYRIASSVGAGVTGFRGDIIVVDDPHDINKAENIVDRKAKIDWWRGTMSTRVNDIRQRRRVVIQQRVHMADLAGWCKEQGYECLVLPMRYEAKAYVDMTTLERLRFDQGKPYDSRTHEGQLLWPTRYPEAEVKRLEEELGSYRASAQLQQRPSPRAGGMFKRENWKIQKTLPAGIRLIRYWDLAATEETTKGDPDYTAGGLIGQQDGITYIADMVNERFSPAGVELKVKTTALQDGQSVNIYIEQEPGASGKSLVSHYKRVVLPGFAVFEDRASGDKIFYATPFAAQQEAGNVVLIEGPWNDAFIEQAAVFPLGKHDDMIDAASKGYAQLLAHPETDLW